MRYYAGIDPGTKGGLTIIDEDRTVVTALRFSKSTEQEIADALKEYPLEMVILEKVSAMPGNGGASMFKFGQAFGEVQGMMTMGAIPYDLITPQRWQKALHLTLAKGKKSQPERKRQLKAEAQRLYPGDKRLVLENADAYLLAELCWRWQRGAMGGAKP